MSSFTPPEEKAELEWAKKAEEERMSDWYPGGAEWDECNLESVHEHHGWERKGERVSDSANKKK